MTDAVLGEVRALQERPLDAIYPVIWLDVNAFERLQCRHGDGVHVLLMEVRVRRDPRRHGFR